MRMPRARALVCMDGCMYVRTHVCMLHVCMHVSMWAQGTPTMESGDEAGSDPGGDIYGNFCPCGCGRDIACLETVGSFHRLSGVRGRRKGGSVWIQHSWWEEAENKRIQETVERQAKFGEAWRVRYLSWPEFLAEGESRGNSVEHAEKSWDRVESKWEVNGVTCVRYRDHVVVSPTKRR